MAGSIAEFNNQWDEDYKIKTATGDLRGSLLDTTLIDVMWAKQYTLTITSLTHTCLCH